MSEHADRNLAIEAVRVTEAAAIAAARFLGRGDEKAADQAAVDAMHAALAALAIDGTIRIGEGAREETAKLFVGEKVGTLRYIEAHHDFAREVARADGRG